jgi:toxin ParE1/3/4
MNQPKLTDQTEADLEDIWVHIARDSPANATRFIGRILARCERLADMPGTGRTRTDLGPELRSVSVGNYLIFYRAIEGGIEIVRVLHGRRDIAALFAGRD